MSGPATLRSLAPVLHTPDLEGTVAFYTDVLGFRCAALSREWGWAMVERDAVRVMFARPDDHRPFDGPGFTGSIYFYPDDVDREWRRLKDRVRVSYPIEDFDYGMREFAILDNNGYLLQFGQELPEDDGAGG